jgi:hypothetical protein
MLWGNQATFVQHWQFAQQRNSLDTKQWSASQSRATATVPCHGKADKFLNDLNAEIEQGWTGSGTNQSVTRTHCHAFLHLWACPLYRQALRRQALVHDIVTIAQNLPGYHDWCQHQQEVEKRAQDWRLAIEQSHYFHYGTDNVPVELSP